MIAGGGLCRACAFALLLPALADIAARDRDESSYSQLPHVSLQQSPKVQKPMLVASSEAVLLPLHALHQAKHSHEDATRETPSTSPVIRNRRLLVAYLLWLCLGWEGCHHLYLGRNRAALFSALTFGGFGLGWVMDAFAIPRWIHELELADAAREYERQQPVQSVLAAAVAADSAGVVEYTRYDGPAAMPQASRRSALRGSLCYIARLCTRFAICHWYMMHATRLLPPETTGVVPALLRASGTGVALWLTAAASDGFSFAGTTLIMLVWLVVWLLQPAFGLQREMGHGPLFIALIIAEWLPRVLPRLSTVVAPRRPKRTWLLCAWVIIAAFTCWMGAAYSALLRWQVEVMLDGKLRTANGQGLLHAVLCGLHPSRFVGALRLKREPICIKHSLERLMGTTFDIFCLLPNRINHCLDWDLSGQRWTRVGLSVAEAYKVLGIAASASASEVKSMHRRLSLELHPDKTTAQAGSADAIEASGRFMKAQRAYETIMESRASNAQSPRTRRKAPASGEVIKRAH